MLNKIITTSALALVLIGCGRKHGSSSQLGIKDTTNFIPVAQAEITISNGESISLLEKLVMPPAYAALTTATVNYVYSPIGSIALNALLPMPSGPIDFPMFGTLGVSDFDSNNLRLCSGGTRCPYAILRAYVSSRSATFNDFGANVVIGSSTLSDLDGSSEAITLATGTITTNRIRLSNPSQNPFGSSISDLGDLKLDLSDANTGNYSVTVVVELAIGE